MHSFYLESFQTTLVIYLNIIEGIFNTHTHTYTYIHIRTHQKLDMELHMRHTFILTPFRKLRQEECEFKASVGYLDCSVSKKQNLKHTHTQPGNGGTFL